MDASFQYTDRRIALELAIEQLGGGADPEELLARAQIYLDFLGEDASAPVRETPEPSVLIADTPENLPEEALPTLDETPIDAASGMKPRLGDGFAVRADGERAAPTERMIHTSNASRVVNNPADTLQAVTAALKRLRAPVSMGTLAEEAGQTIKATQSAVRKIAEDGHLFISGNKRGTRYRWMESAS